MSGISSYTCFVTSGRNEIAKSPFTHWLYKVVAIVDPPRAGLSEKAVQQLRSSRVNKLIFVSSDPKATIR